MDNGTYISEILDAKIVRLLLKDKTTRKNILWETEGYAHLGEDYAADREIQLKQISGKNNGVIRPRIQKSKEEQTARVRNKAEVFTPSWVCNKQNNLIDDAWFGKQNVFNVESEKEWATTEGKIIFPQDKTWQSYVVAKRLEISCGEAPYLVSRYDTVTGETIPVADRIGLLDRKLRVVCENCDSEQEWVKWAIKAVKSTYGYDWQGDNIFLARQNILLTFAEYYQYKFTVPAIKPYLYEIANIVAWNIWQMDGMRCVVPNSCHPTEEVEVTLFGEKVAMHECEGCATGNKHKHNGIYCLIDNSSAFRWTSARIRGILCAIKKKGAFKMKWNVILKDYETGKFKPYNIFEHEAFRSAIEKLFERQYPQDRFLKELDQEARYYFWAQIEWEIFITTWPPYINAEEISRIISAYHINRPPEQALPEYIDVNVAKWYKIDVYNQLRANWERFADYVWRESQK